MPSPFTKKGELRFRAIKILQKIRNAGPGAWLPPKDVPQGWLDAFVQARFLRIGDPPNTDCYEITADGIKALSNAELTLL